MSKNSNQSTPAETDSQVTQTATPQGETQNQATENQQATPKEGESQQAALTPDEIDARIADGIAKGLAAYQKQEDEKKVAAQIAEKAAQEAAEKALEDEKAKAPKSTWPYGNKDKDHDFDLSKMTNWTGLPDDKVLIVIPAFNTDAAGNKIGYDLKNSLIQPVDPVAHKQQSTPDKSTGSTTYGLLGISPIVVHDPSK